MVLMVYLAIYIVFQVSNTWCIEWYSRGRRGFGCLLRSAMVWLFVVVGSFSLCGRQCFVCLLRSTVFLVVCCGRQYFVWLMWYVVVCWSIVDVLFLVVGNSFVSQCSFYLFIYFIYSIMYMLIYSIVYVVNSCCVFCSASHWRYGVLYFFFLHKILRISLVFYLSQFLHILFYDKWYGFGLKDR